MSETERIVLKPTRWFILRAGAMLAMFGVFGGWFLYDWKVGYPKQNLAYALHTTFERAGREFAALNADGSTTPADWERFAAAQTVALPEGQGLLPAGTPRPMPWPDLLKDHRRLAADGWHKLWLEFSAGRRMDANPPEHPAVPGKVAFDAKKLREQAVMGGVCALLALGAAWVLLRTLRRTIEADAGGLTAADGRRIEFRQFDRLDKRKWKSKGLAYAWFDAGGSRRRIRIDGLTYGGFRKEDGEPAERLMQRLEANFSGELIDYAE